jgi:hypothetical protein
VYAACDASAPAAADATGGYIGSNACACMPDLAARDDTMAQWLWRWSVQQVQLPEVMDLSEPGS